MLYSAIHSAMQVGSVRSAYDALNIPVAMLAPIEFEFPPSIFEVDQWTLASNGATSLRVTILDLPAANGYPITDVEYSVDDAPYVSGGSIETFVIEGLVQDVAVNVEIRAANKLGEGDDSVSKTETPTGAGA